MLAKKLQGLNLSLFILIINSETKMAAIPKVILPTIYKIAHSLYNLLTRPIIAPQLI